MCIDTACPGDVHQSALASALCSDGPVFTWCALPPQTMAAQLPPATPRLTAVEDALKIVQEQLTCAICLDSYTDPKLLNCFHVFCTKCLQPLVRQGAQGQTIQCPNCRQPTTLPQNGVQGLQVAFHVEHLFDIRDTLKKVSKTSCEKCKKNDASAYCRTCGFVCDRCKEIHTLWEDLTSHEVISLDKLTGDVTRMVPPQKKVLYCSKHEGKELELFCETCSELICHNCATKIYKGHNCDVVSDTFETHKAELVASMAPVRQQLSIVRESLKQLELRCKAITDNQAAVEGEIAAFTEKLIATVTAKKAALIRELAKTTDKKLNSLSSQEDEMKMVQARLSGCLEVVERSLKTGTRGEVLAAKKAILKKVRDLTADFQPSSLVPREQADTRLAPNHATVEACQKYGDLYADPVCPEKCTLEGVRKLGSVQKEATSTLCTFNKYGKKSKSPHQVISCELVSSSSTTSVSGAVKRTGMGQYELCYQAPRSGRYQLQVKVEGQHIQGSPFSITAVRDLTTPIRTITGLKWPWGVAINRRGQIVVAEHSGHCITIFSASGDKIRSFGRRGSGPGELKEPCGVTLDKDGNILVADNENHRIQKFSPEGKFLETQGKKGTNVLEFQLPTGVGIHPLNNKLYITESNSNHRVQILDASLNYVSMFGSYGSGNGEFKHPWDISFDTAGQCYVADNSNGRVQVFTEDGQYLRQFGMKGKGQGEIGYCPSIAIDCDIVYIAVRENSRVSLFTTKGSFLTSFGTKGSGPGQFNQPHGITVDGSGLVYVSDSDNGRIQVF